MVKESVPFVRVDLCYDFVRMPSKVISFHEQRTKRRTSMEMEDQIISYCEEITQYYFNPNGTNEDSDAEESILVGIDDLPVSVSVTVCRLLCYVSLKVQNSFMFTG